jgi:hypothetical protein
MKPAYWVAGLAMALTRGAFPAAPSDLDRDGDVDVADFALFQACLTGVNVPQISPACQDARLDDDADVDIADFGVFQLCASGAHVPAARSCTPQRVPFFPRETVWYQNISQAPTDPESIQVINWLAGAGGFGNGRLQIDFSIEVLTADASAPMRTFIPTDDFYSPDCDQAQVPVPPGGAIEGETGYQCLSDGD